MATPWAAGLVLINQQAAAVSHRQRCQRRRIVETAVTKDPGCGRLVRMSGSSIVVDNEIGVTKAEVGNKEAASSITGEIDVTKAEVGNKEAAGPGVVTEVSWIEFVFPVKQPVGRERKAEPTGAMITKEMVPDSFIYRLKKRPVFKRLPSINDDISDVYLMFPKMREGYLGNMARWNYLIDLHEDVLRQHAEKGFAEVGVDFTDGVTKIFILP
jgi:hypothetical protein